MSTSARSLELFFIDGTPDGMLTAEVFNWTGHLLFAPRTRLQEALRRKEAKHTGIYILLGVVDDEQTAYIGESENIASRITSHDAKLDWWDSVVLITTTSDNLHKAHVKYLESRLVEKAKFAGLTNLQNGNTPTKSSLSEAHISNMEVFLETSDLVLPALGVRIFQPNTRPSKVFENNQNDGARDTFFIESARNNLKADAYIDGPDFVVISGSTARSTWIGTKAHNLGYATLHEKLIARGVIQVTNGNAVFTENYAFRSPSAAAAIIHGRAANGRTEWKHTETNLTYAEMEQKRLDEDQNK